MLHHNKYKSPAVARGSRPY